MPGTQWERLRRGDQEPVEASGVRFEWVEGEAPLAPLALEERWGVAR